MCERKRTKSDREKAKRQLERYAGSERLKELLEKWTRSPLFWVVCCDVPTLGEEEVVDMKAVKLLVEGPYTIDEDAKLKLCDGER